jgi:hypothetical protein
MPTKSEAGREVQHEFIDAFDLVGIELLGSPCGVAQDKNRRDDYNESW